MADFRDLLFATQEPEEIMKGFDRSGGPPSEPWLLFDQAVGARRTGRDGDAAKALRRVFETGRETRMWLWALNGLRALGVPPSEELAGQVMGVVVEIPMPGGLDTLAAYADGSARYINYSGKIIVWDRPPPNALHGYFAELFPAVIALSETWPAGPPQRPATGQAGITILMAEGPLFSTAPLTNGVVEGRATAVFASASRMLAALVAECEKASDPFMPATQLAEDPDIAILRQGHGEERWKALGRITEKGPQAIQAVPALNASATGHPNPKVREQAATILKQLGR